MSEIAPHILELAKREYGENCELVQATEWSAAGGCVHEVSLIKFSRDEYRD
jgi:hypothetical protein